MKFYRQAQLSIKLLNNEGTGYLPFPIIIKNLRVSFSITKTLYHNTNPGVIRIWNLKQSTRNMIKDYGDEVTLSCGYENEDNLQVIFIGETTAVSHVYDQPEIITILECGDGEKYLNQIRVTLAYSANISAVQILNDIAKQSGLVQTRFNIPQNLEWINGFSFSGMAREALTKVVDKLNCQWSVQNGVLQVIPIQGTIKIPFININANTGMQGIPTRYTYKRLDLFRAIDRPTTGYKVNVALNPFLTPGIGAILYSSHIDFKGPYRVESVTHIGDNYGPLWQSKIEVTELKNTL